MRNPHDALFRKVFTRPDLAVALLRCALPTDLCAAIDWDTVAPVPAEFCNGKLRGHRADLLFVACLAADPTRRVYFLLEHKSLTHVRTIAQLWRYAAQVFERHREVYPGTPPPAVIPLLVHHGPRPWHQDRGRTPPAVVAPFLEGARIVVFDLERLGEAAVRALPMPPLGRLALLCLRGLPRRRPAEVESALRRWADLLAEVQAGDPGGEGLEAVSWYVQFATELTNERLARLFAELLGPDAEGIPMSTGAKIEREAREKGREEGRGEGRKEGREEGREEGRGEGRKEGREEGRADLLQHQLTVRFGPLAVDVEARIRSGTAADLERWAIAVLTAETLDEVFAA